MHKLYKQQKDHRYFCGNRYEKYSIKKLKLGAASVLIGAGFLFGYNVDRVEADSVTEPTEAVVTKNSDTGLKLPQGNTQAKAVSESKVDNVGEAELAEKPNLPEEPEKSIEQVKPVKENEKDTEHASTGSENANTAEGTETKPSVDLSLLQAKLADLEAQIERIRGNKKQASQIQNAEKLVAEARQYLSTLDATQSGADKKANEVSSLTSILKSIKAEEISKVNKNQNSRNGKKMQEGTGFRTGVTEQALIGSIHFDNSNGPIEKQIPVANNGDGERVINMSITYSASSSETVTDGKVRVTIPKAFLHSYKKPEFKNSSLVKSTDDRSTATEYIYDLNLNPISGGTVAESLLKLYVGTSIKTSPSKGDILSVSADFILGGEILSTKSARASFDYLSEILYKEWDQKDKILKNYIGISGVPLEFKMGSVVDGQFRPIEGGTMRLPLIFSDELFFKNGETIGNGNGRLTSYDYTISGIPDFLELDPVNTKNNKLWTLENGILTLHPDKNLGMDNSVIFGGPVLRLKEGAFNNSQSVAEVIESNSTKGFIANIEYKAVGHRPDGSTFTQIITNPDGYRLYVGERVPTIGEITNYVRTDSFQRLFSYAPNEDVFEANFSIPSSKLKGDGAYYPSEYINYFIPKDQKGNYFTKFRIDKVHRNEIQSNGVKKVVGEFFQENIQGNFKENFKLYGIGKNNQAELIKEYTSVDDIYNLVEINPEKKYEHLVLKHPGIVDEFKKFDSTSKTITGLKTILGVTVGTWKEKALNNAIQRYENKIVQTSSPENTLDSAITMEQPETGTSNPAVHTKELTKLSLIMEQVGEQTLTKDNLSRGQSIPISVGYTARDYFILAETVNNKIKNYDFEKFDSNINKTTMMVLADSNLPLKDFRLTIDNRLLTKNTMFLTKDNNGSYGKSSYNKIKDDYETVNPTKIVENYKGTGKRAYIFDSKDLGISNYNLDKENGLSDIVYKPVALTFEVENTGQIKAGTYGIDSYLVWNSESETLVGNDSSINADFLENHPSGRSIAKASIDVTILNPAEYSTSLTIAKPGTTGVRGINDVKNGQEVILSPQIENLTDIPQKVKEAVVLIPKNEAVTYLEGPIADNSDEYDIVYTTSTTTDKTTGTYVTADQITNWKDVTAVKYVFKNNYTITREHAFKHNFNLRVDQNNPNYVESTSQIFLKNAQDAWLKSNIVGLRTEDVRGKLEVYYKTVDGELLKEFPKTSDFEGTSYAVSREPILRQFKNKSYITNDYLLVGVQQDSAPEMSTYERKVTKRITYLYEKANVKVETKELIRTINYIEKNNEGNVITTPVKQTVILSKKTYTGEKTGSVVEDGWEIPENAKWTSVTSPTPSEWEKPEVKVNDQYIAKEVIDEVVITPEVLNNGNVDVNVYYPRLVPVGGDVVAKYIVEGTTNELKPATDVAKGLKVGKSYTSTAPVAGEELTATDGKVYIYKGHKATSAPETGKVKSDNQEIIYEYVPKQGGTIVAKYVIKGETTELKASTPVSTGAQVGSDYTATAPQAGEVLKQGELEYVLEGRKADSAPETGKVKSDNQEIIYEYVPKQGGTIVAKYVIKGETTELKASTPVSTGAQVGSDYTATAPQAGEVLKQGELEYVLEGRKADSAPETGKVKSDNQEIIYEYVPKQGGTIVAKYVIKGETTELKASTPVSTGAQVGSDYTATAPQAGEVLKQGELEYVLEGRKADSALETGKVTADNQEIIYEYVPKQGGTIVAKYVIKGETTELKASTPVSTGAQVGSDYTATAPQAGEVLKQGELEYVLEGRKADSAPETGKVKSDNQEIIYEYVPKQGGTIVAKYVIKGETTELKASTPVSTGAQVGSDYTATAPQAGEVLKQGELEYVLEGRKADSSPETGKVKSDNQEIIYEYVPKQGGTIVAKYVIKGETTELKASTPVSTGAQVGSDYTATAPQAGEVLKQGELEYVLEGRKADSSPETGKVKSDNQEIIYEYVPKQGGTIVAKYVIKGETTELKASTPVSTGAQVGSDYTATAPQAGEVLKQGELEYVLEGRKADSAPETGKVKSDNQEIIYEYVPKQGGTIVAKYVIKGETTELKASTPVSTGAQVGSDYTATAPQAGEVLKQGELEYVLEGRKADSAPETGKVKSDNQEIIYEYVPKQGGTIVAKYVIKGETTELKASTPVSTGAQVGSDYTATAPQAGEVLKQGELEYVLEGRKADSAPETGKVKSDNQEIIYEYVPKQGGTIVAKYVIKGETTELKASTPVSTGAQVGSDYTATAPQAGEVLKQGELEYVLEGRKADSAPETGKVKSDNQEIIYEYVPKQGGTIVAKYVIKGETTELKASTPVSTGAQVGSDYTATAPQAGEVLKQGELEYVLEGRKADSAPETGKVKSDNQEIIYEYVPKQGGTIVAKYVIKGETTELKASTPVSTGAQVGSDYTATAPQAGEVLKQGELEYVLEGRKADSAPETGKVTADNQEIIYEYVPKQGGTIVAKYVIKGETTELKASTPVSTGAQVGSDYTATAPQAGEVLKQGELEYVLEGRKADSAPETGKVKSDNQEIIYEYVPKQGGKVEVKYVIAGTETNLKDPVTLVTNGQVGSDYTATKENTLTKDGLVYELVKINNGLKAGSATETGKVTEAKQEVVYEYELQRGDVVVNYVDTEGNPIVGKASVKAQNQSPTGTNYNTNTPELKPTTITTDNGDVYEFVKKSETSAPETGTLSKGVTTVEYVYRKVVTTYVDETGKEINPSDKGTKDKKDIPEYIYKETKKDEKGNTTHVYRQVVTSYVNEEGKEINPSDKGTKDKKDIPEYIFKETKKDEKGNTTHVYRQVVTSYVNEEGKEINPSDKGTKDKKDIPEYIYKETKKDEKGNTTHVYRQVVTSYVNEEGKEINPSDKGTKDKKDIPEYIYKETKKDEKGNTTHVYRQVVTSYVNEEGKEITTSEKGTKDKKDIPEYIFKETKKDEKGNTIHVYRQVVTSYVNEEGKEITPSDKGTKDKKDIPEYTFKETKKDKDGNTIHVYTKKSSSTPDSPKPSTPSNEESKSTIWKDTEGNVLKPQEDGTKDKGTFTGYEYVKTILVGNVTTHIFKKVITPSHDGTPSHPDVTVTSDKSTQIANSNESTFVDGKRELPNTGTQSSTSSLLLGALAAMTGLGLVSRRRKDDKE